MTLDLGLRPASPGSWANPSSIRALGAKDTTVPSSTVKSGYHQTKTFGSSF
ncbi:hypothetical protein [Streptomyces sp. NPDC058964]|uniref:hypothetical protein n=1 Tax=Streptomyces sp. NPDC058964 TaxID=3346681 RepID=UPI0036CBD5B4